MDQATRSSESEHRLRLCATWASHSNEILILKLSAMMAKQQVLSRKGRVAEVKGSPFILTDDLPERVIRQIFDVFVDIIHQILYVRKNKAIPLPIP